MENSSYQGGDCGEEIERALMDLGPLLGVTIKEEVPDDLPEPASASRNNNVGGECGGSGAEGGLGGAGAEGGSCGEGGESGKGEGGADSLASPAGRAPFSALRCVLCQAALAHAEGTPKLMECLHSACEPCIKLKLDEKLATTRDFLGAGRVTISCPACRLQCQPSNMIDQRFVLEKVAIEQAGTNGTASNDQQCNSCDDTEPANSYCVDCAEFICDNCVSAHQRLKITKEHSIKSREEALGELTAPLAAQAARAAHDMFCRDHAQERLTLFCETCDRLTCRDCQLQHHRDHKYQFSTEMAAQARASIAALLSEVSYKRVLLGSAMKVIRDRQQLIADKKKALVHEITQTVVKLTNAINTRGKQLVLRLNEVCDGKQRTLSEKKEALEQLAAITDHCVEFVNCALEQGSDTAVLYSKRAVCAHLQRIKSRRADIPNPEIPVRIALALDKLPDLVRVLSTIGAIVVDGKVDGGGASPGGGGGGGGGGSAQGPYHPPAPAPAPPAPAHSAVVALQQVAMHQSYVQAAASGAAGGAGGAGAGAGGAGRQYLALGGARPHTPLRHPHVTSTTHPHHIPGMNEMNLRGLLNANGQRSRQNLPALPALPAQAAMQHAYQQMMGAYASNAFGGGSGRRSGGPRTPSPAPAPAPHYAHPALHAQHAQHPQHTQHPQHAQQHHSAKWHIPQHSLTNGGAGGASGAGGCAAGGAAGGAEGGAEYKITLGRQHAPAASLAPAHAHAHAPAHRAPVVTSTNPKTPSPSLNGGVSSELDKVCAESVQDLMATIAKLDSNGVQVVAEAGASPAPSPALVHSSTDAPAAPSHGKVSGSAGGAGDPNEDWCAVCMDGGELMCCDKCPKVFHQYCHIPTIEKLPDETESWQCLLCVNFADPSEAEEPGGGGGGGAGAGLSARQQRLVERITLELYCQYESSLPFREPVPAENLHYHSKIVRPMCLDMIRMKLQPRAALRYTHVAQFVADVRLLFRNAYRYNPVPMLALTSTA